MTRPEDNSTTAFDSLTFDVEAPDGRKIAAMLTAQRGTLCEPLPVVMVPPAAGKVMRNSLQVALTLAKNGFKVCRYDSLNHPGSSDGEMVDFTMSSALMSLQAVLKTTLRREGVTSAILVASSLSMRVAIRAAVSNPSVENVIGLLGTLNLQKTLCAVFDMDVFVEPELPETMTYESFTINSRTFVKDALENGWHSLEAAIADLRRIDAPVSNIVSEKDTWVAIGDVQRALELGWNGPRQIFILPEGKHDVRANPAALRILLTKMVQLAKRTHDPPIQLPRFSEVVVENEIERNLSGQSTSKLSLE